ncbi:WG repeat-containing protein [Hymenobacter norwichensis]|uniref:WG repeat-containing protein n=1 Tax=Hymenobacter norwichensis TaxID=223903 RepID=UPI0003B5C185|nr:WG repeat-containing protein [Hymenobacter norwichensis]
MIKLLFLLFLLAYPSPPEGPVMPVVYEFQQVQRLVVTPEPPGGLVPFRRTTGTGTTWGYADTTGRLVVQTALAQEPPLLVGGYAKMEVKPAGYWVLNARGEYLRVGPDEVVVPAKQGGLMVRAKADNTGQVYVSGFPQEFWKDDTTPRRYCTDEDYADPTGRRYRREPLQLGWQAPAQYPKALPLGDGLFSVKQSDNGASAELWQPGKYALLNGAGQRLTAFRYDWLEHFRNGRALLQRDGRIGYLDRQGREAIGPRYADVYGEKFAGDLAATAEREFSWGVVQVLDDSLRRGVIDTTGRVVVPFRRWLALSEPDGAGFMRAQGRTAAGDTLTQFFRPDGRPAFRATFTAATDFWQGRAVVRRGRFYGLINRRGQLVVPCRYEALYFPEPRTNLFDAEPEPIAVQNSLCEFVSSYSSFERPELVDTLYMQFWHQGKSGFVERRRGRQIVPPRYHVVEGFRNGFAWVRRDTQDYLLDRRGREITAAHPDSYFWDWQRSNGRQTHFLLTTESRQGFSDTWMLTDTLGRVLIPPQSRGLFPREVTGGGLVIVYTDAEWGLMGAGGQWVLPLGQAQHIAQYDSLVVAVLQPSPVGSAVTMRLYSPRGQLLRELPHVTSQYYYPELKRLFVRQQNAAGQGSAQLLDQAGLTRLTLPYDVFPEQLPPLAPRPQRRPLLHLPPEHGPDGYTPLPNGQPGGYISLNGRQFWVDESQ